MFQTLINVFKIPELRNKILFTLAMLAVYRIGHWIPIPGANHEAIAKAMDLGASKGSAAAKIADFVSIFSGGNLSRSTIFGLGINAKWEAATGASSDVAASSGSAEDGRGARAGACGRSFVG